MNRYVASLILAVFLYPFCAFAGEVAVLDFNRIAERLKVFQEAYKLIEGKSELYKATLMKERQEIDNKYKDLEAKSHILSKEAYQAAKDQITNDSAAFQQKVHKVNSIITAANYEASSALMAEITKLCKVIAEEKGLKAVLHLPTLVYYDASIDITEDVLSRLNVSMKKLEISFNGENEVLKIDGNADKNSATKAAVKAKRPANVTANTGSTTIAK